MRLFNKQLFMMIIAQRNRKVKGFSKKEGKKMKANSTVRERAREQGVFLWEIAQAIGKSEPTVIRMLRIELPEERKTELLRIIDQIAERRNPS